METLTLDDADKARVNEALAQCALFRALKPEHMPQLLKVAQVERYSDGETVIRQGDPSDSFFVLVQGEATIRIEGAQGDGAGVELGRVPHPASFGEIGLLLDEPRTASVVAAHDLTVLKFGAKAFEAMFSKIPDFGAALSTGLAHRVRALSGRVPLPDYDTRKGPPRPEVAGLLPVDFRQRHRVLPLEVDGNVLTLGMVDDPARHVVRSVREHVPGMELHPVRIGLEFFDKAMQQVAGVPGWVETKGGAPPAAEKAGARSPRLDAMLERMIAEGASDLHLSAGHRPHWRVDGDIQALKDAGVLGETEVLTLLEPLMEARHREQFTQDGDADFAYSIPGVARFRVNAFKDYRGVNAVFRLIPSKILSLEQLGLPPVIQNFCDMPKGLVLVTGPTGSGKSTTLAAMIDSMNTKQKLHIVTVEDPIEFLHQSRESLINQRELGGHTKSFARALRAALREDPDVILVGEMRDLETIALALEAANTGHLVLATLHTNSAVGAVDRVIDQFPAGQQEQIRSTLADVLRGVVAQTLVRGASGGRLAVLEVMVVNFAVSNLIREGKTVQIPGIMQSNKALGMSLLNEELGRLVEAKKITMEEALGASVDKEDLHRRFRSGVTLAAAPPEYDRFRVMAVDADSPGAQAGLQRGDLIIELESRPAKDFTLDEARQILRSDGKRMFTVDRGGKRVKINMELKRF
jgi:twitching motility protein PilT